MTNLTPAESPNRLWPRSTSRLLLLVGVLLGALAFILVLALPDLTWHPARDAELRATYETYQDTGTLLIKPTGSGSYGVQAPASGPLTSAAWDDDPGSYIIASLMSHVTGSDSPYPGLKLIQALLIALPLVWLPTAVARTLKSAGAGFALILLPAVVWVLNHGALFIGTEYGLSDALSPVRVYALYGIAASLAFLSLSLILLLSTYKLRTTVLIGASLLIAVLAGFGNLARSLSGIGVAAAVGVLWWIHTNRRWRWVAGVLASLAAIALALGVQTGVMNVINTARAETTGTAMAEVPDGHTVWHSLYLGLSYPEPINGIPSEFDVTWSDEFGWEKAREVDPDVLVASEEYDAILKDLYWEKVTADPFGAVKLYIKKAVYLAGEFAGLIVFIVAGFAVGFIRHKRLRKPLGITLAIALPVLILGLAPSILVMPLLYYYSELTAALGLLAAVSLGVLAWSLAHLPSQIRARERKRLRDRQPIAGPVAVAPVAAAGLSVVVAARDDENSIAAIVDGLASGLSAQDELIVVDDGSTDATPSLLRELSEKWAHGSRLVLLTSKPGLGEALRTGVLASTGERVLLVADGLPHPTRVTDFLRDALLQSRAADNRSRLRVDGDWVRAFAVRSRETGPLWLDEVALAAELQGVTVEAPDTESATAVRTPWFRFRGSLRSLTGYIRLAVHKNEYHDEVEATPTPEPAAA